MRIVAAILAAGSGRRFGGDKTEAPLAGRPVWRWSFDTFASHPKVDRVFVVTSPEKVGRLSVETILGGETRQASSWAAVQAAGDADILLVHDAARPFVDHATIDRVLAGIEEATSAGAAMAVTDTIKEVDGNTVRTLDRNRLWAMQTPQGAYRDVLRKAHDLATADLTDEMALVEALGVHPRLVAGDPRNFKITTPEDLERARSLLGGETRTGFGYDIHPFSDDPSRTLMLGGVAFPGHRALEGHSDADVLLHAVTDALLGAAALGDIGVHFPNTDERWRGEPSLTFLRHAAALLADEGWSVANVDATVVAETPKVMKQALEIRSAIAAAIGIDVSRVSVKATTNERLGSLGRSEGIAALATATVRR